MATYSYEQIQISKENISYRATRLEYNNLTQQIDTAFNCILSREQTRELGTLISRLDSSISFYVETEVEDARAATLTIDGCTIFNLYPIVFFGIEEYRQIYKFLTDSISQR